MALQCIVVTPENTAVDEPAEFVAVPLFDGELGIGLGHSPMIGRLGFGELRLKSGGATKRFYVDGGFVQVADNVVSVLTNRAIPATGINANAAAEQLEAAAKRPSNTPELMEIRDRLVAQARGQLAVAKRRS